MDDMQHLDGSRARKPHSSSLSNPLCHGLALIHRLNPNAPHAQHINKMLLSHVVFLVYIPLQGREDILLVHEPLAALSLHINHGLVGNASIVRRREAPFGGNAEVFELLPENYNSLF